MRKIVVSLSAAELEALVHILAHVLQQLRPRTHYEKLLYLTFSKIYTRLFTKQAFLRPNQKVGLRPEEACAFCLWFAEENPGAYAPDSFEGALVHKLVATFDQHLS